MHIFRNCCGLPDSSAPSHHICSLPLYVRLLPVFGCAFLCSVPPTSSLFAQCATHIQHKPSHPNTPSPSAYPIPTNAPHFSRSCGIKIRAGTQLRALVGIAVHCPHYGVLLNRPTVSTWDPEGLFLTIGIRCWFLNKRMESCAVLCLYLYCRLPLQEL